MFSSSSFLQLFRIPKKSAAGCTSLGNGKGETLWEPGPSFLKFMKAIYFWYKDKSGLSRRMMMIFFQTIFCIWMYDHESYNICILNVFFWYLQVSWLHDNTLFCKGYFVWLRDTSIASMKLKDLGFSKWKIGPGPKGSLKDPCNMWMFPKIGVFSLQNGWFIMENRINMDDLGVPLFLKTPMYICIHSIICSKGILSIWGCGQPASGWLGWTSFMHKLHVHVHVYIYIYSYIIHIYMYICKYIHIYIYTYIHIYIYTYIHIYIYAYMHICIYAYMHIYIYICMWMRMFFLTICYPPKSTKELLYSDCFNKNLEKHPPPRSPKRPLECFVRLVPPGVRQCFGCTQIQSGACWYRYIYIYIQGYIYIYNICLYIIFWGILSTWLTCPLEEIIFYYWYSYISRSHWKKHIYIHTKETW